MEYPKVGKFLEGVLVNYQHGNGKTHQVILMKYGDKECSVSYYISPLRTIRVDTKQLFVIGRL